MMTPTHNYPLFVYGTLMPGEPAYGRVAAAVVQTAPGRLHGAILHAVSWYPMAVPGQGVVQGEILWLQEAAYARVLQELDAYEGDEYDRVVRPVQMGESPMPVDCWVYLGDARAARAYRRVPGGNWRNRQEGE